MIFFSESSTISYIFEYKSLTSQAPKYMTSIRISDSGWKKNNKSYLNFEQISVEESHLYNRKEKK